MRIAVLFYGVNFKFGFVEEIHAEQARRVSCIFSQNSNLPPTTLHREEEAWKGVLCEAVATPAQEAEALPLRVSYAEMTERFEENVFGGKQPKRALEVVREKLREKGVRVETGVSVRKNTQNMRGFKILSTNPECV